MDDWQRRLARDIVAETPAGKLPDAEATLEVAFGDARAAVTYALELARAYRLPAAGSVVGDHLWMRLGDGKMRLTLNRRSATIEADVSLCSAAAASASAQPGAKDAKAPDNVAIVSLLTWRQGEGALVDDRGTPTDLGAVARAAIDALVADWKARPPAEKKLSSAPPPDLEDTPTRG
jgi:hypothetical protein